jgi:hypothetical protein
LAAGRLGREGRGGSVADAGLPIACLPPSRTQFANGAAKCRRVTGKPYRPGSRMGPKPWPFGLPPAVEPAAGQVVRAPWRVGVIR